MPARNKKAAPAVKTPSHRNPAAPDRNLPRLHFILFGLGLTILFFIIFQTIYDTPYSATGIYLEFADHVFDGQVPYRDFALEYPPLALLFFLIPRLFTSQWPVYSILYQVEVLIFAWLGLWVTLQIARRMGKAPWKLLAPYTLGILCIGPIIGQQYDIFPAVMTLLSLYYFWLGRTKTSWVWLGCGVMTKLFPVLLVPLYLIIYWKNRQAKNILRGLLALGLTCLVLLIPFLITGPQHLRSLVEYHSQRGIQIESTYGAFLLLADQLGLTSVSLSFNYGSWNVYGGPAETISTLSLYFQLAVFLGCYLFIWSQVKKGKSQFTRLGAYVLLLFSALLCTSKVFSPQYIIWLFPLIALVFTRWRPAIWLTFAFLGLLTYLIFPLCYFPLLARDPGMVVILSLRESLLVLLAALAVVSLKSMKSSD